MDRNEVEGIRMGVGYISEYIFVYHFETIKSIQYHLFLPRTFNLNHEESISKVQSVRHSTTDLDSSKKSIILGEGVVAGKGSWKYFRE